jgi:putative polyketide hydroxylase
VYLIGDEDWCHAYDVEPDGAVLVRPDGHVAWRQPTSTDAGATLPYVLARAVLRSRG